MIPGNTSPGRRVCDLTNPTIDVLPAGPSPGLLRDSGIPTDAILNCRVVGEDSPRRTGAIRVEMYDADNLLRKLVANAAGFSCDAMVIAEARLLHCDGVRPKPTTGGPTSVHL